MGSWTGSRPVVNAVIQVDDGLWRQQVPLTNRPFLLGVNSRIYSAAARWNLIFLLGSGEESPSREASSALVSQTAGTRSCLCFQLGLPVPRGPGPRGRWKINTREAFLS